MNKTTRLLGGLLIAAIATSCGTGGKNQPAQTTDPLANSPVVGQYVQVGDDQVMSCDQKLLGDTVRIPLSHFAEEMEIVKLDSRDEALVGQTAITVSDNYLLAHSGYPPTAFKLFDRKGNYIAEIGGIGQGPNEYTSVYDAQIDELNQRIYLMPWQSDKLLVFDMQGKVLEPIPLGYRCPKARFYVDPVKGTITVATLPWSKTPAIVWIQDRTGKHLQEIEPGHLKVEHDTFNQEIMYSPTLPDVFNLCLFSMFPPQVDTLYQYDTERNRLKPVFTFNHTITDPVPWHGYFEWPDHFVGEFSEPPVERKTEESWTFTQGETFSYIIDKKSGKGAYLKLYNDYLGNQDIQFPDGIFNKGYFVRSIEPGNLLTDIENALKKQDITDAMRKKLTDLQGTIDEDDNNYVMIAKLKK
ncbi:6-bladed beta-propeller [uncultured Parabacteroides sp.]|uniref:6-bladed beta-propeller n=1 Tax=uncultured Parabacteroides sp. TaxID=512312 RepID=UPI002658006D|nr:6-bladed beta-propeller [uncultured Parabacteroides sp.]